MRWFVMMILLLALMCRYGMAQAGPRHVIALPGVAAAASPQGQVQLAGKGLVLVRFQGLRLLLVEADADAYRHEAAPDWPAADLLLVLPAAAGRYAGLAPLRALRDGVAVIVPEAAGADDGVARRPPPSGPRLYPLQAWNTLELRKQGTLLRVTAMPGAAGTLAVAGYLLEMGNRRAAYRLYAGGADEQAENQAAVLAQRLPGADLALLPGQDGARLLELNRGLPSNSTPAALTAAGYAFKALKR